MAVTSINTTRLDLYEIEQVASSTPDELWAAKQCREAQNHLERALSASPLRRSREAAKAAQNLIAMQEMLANFQRKENNAQQLEKWHTLDEHLNTALALIANAAFPYPGVERKQLVQAREIVHSILVDGLL